MLNFSNCGASVYVLNLQTAELAKKEVIKKTYVTNDLLSIETAVMTYDVRPFVSVGFGRDIIIAVSKAEIYNALLAEISQTEKKIEEMNTKLSLYHNCLNVI